MRTSKKILLGLLVLLPVVVLIWYAITWLRTTEPEYGSTTIFPTTGLGGSQQGADQLTIDTSSGALSVRNFLKDPSTTEDDKNDGIYYLGNHFSDIGNSTPIPPYVIEYIASTNFFNIGLYTEPIGEARQSAEAYLQQQLGISATQLCSLNAMVSVPQWVNEFYAGKSLGFSFCPSSVQLE